MNMKGCRYSFLAVCALFSMPSVAGVVTGVVDKTPGCLKQVDWRKDAFRNADDSKVVYITSQRFDEFAKCASEGVDFSAAVRMRGPNEPKDDAYESALAKIDALRAKYPSLKRPVGLYLRMASHDLVIGEGTEQEPTSFKRANYFDGTVLMTPISKITHRDIVYVRSPEYPGVCDDLKSNLVAYEWCTGARGPSTQDQRLYECKDEQCDSGLPPDTLDAGPKSR